MNSCEKHILPVAIFKPSPCFSEEIAVWATEPYGGNPVRDVRCSLKLHVGNVSLTWKLWLLDRRWKMSSFALFWFSFFCLVALIRCHILGLRWCMEILDLQWMLGQVSQWLPRGLSEREKCWMHVSHVTWSRKDSVGSEMGSSSLDSTGYIVF